MSLQSFIFSDDKRTGAMTPAELKRRRQYNEQLVASAANTAPVQGGWTEGISRILLGGLGGYFDERDSRIEKGEREKASSDYAKTIGDMLGGAPTSAPAPAGGPTSATAAADMPGDIGRYAKAIQGVESGGKYDIVGPTHPKYGRALGAYQVMEANLPEWTKAAVGREVGPEEFLANKDIQDAVFSNRFGGYVQKFGNAQDAAAAWLTGQPRGPGNTAKDVFGTDSTAYVSKFNAGLEGQPPVQVASLDPSSGMDVAMSGPAAAMAPPQSVAPNPLPPATDMISQAFAGLSPQVQGAAQADAGFDGFAQSGGGVQGAPAAPGAPPQNGLVQDLGAMLAGKVGDPVAPTAAPEDRVASLAKFLENPWLSEGQQAMVGRLVERQLAQNAPLTPEQQFAREKFKYERERDERTTKSWNRLDDDTLYNPATGETKDISGALGNVPKDLGLNPQYGVDKDGNPVLLQLSKDGRVVQSQMPANVSLSKEPIKLDAGTHFVLLDPITRQAIGQVPKDIAGAAAQEKIGAAQGERQVSASSDVQSAQNALDMIEGLRNDPYRARGTGGTSVFNRIPGTGGYDFQNKVDQAKSGAFLTAIQQMKGMGALSNTEGSVATAAINRMDTATSEEAFSAALDDYEKIVRQAMARAQKNLPAGAASPAAAPAPQAMPSADGWTTLPGGVKMRVKP